MKYGGIIFHVTYILLCFVRDFSEERVDIVPNFKHTHKLDSCREKLYVIVFRISHFF